jgi:hypothetical protein
LYKSNQQVKSSSVLGVNVVQSPADRTKITFDMKAYILLQRDRFGLSDDKSVVNNPITPDIVKRCLEIKIEMKNVKLNKNIQYMSLTMTCMWIGRCYRYEILFAVMFFSTFSHCYNEELYNYLLNVLKYLISTVNAKLVYNKSSVSDRFVIKVLADASYGNFPIGCCMIYLDKCLIFVGVDRNKSTSISETDQLTSSMHAEVSTIFDSAKVAVNVYNVVSPISKVELPILLLNDNKSALFNLDGFVANKRTMHLAVKYRYVTELINKKFINLDYLESKALLADLGTKAFTTVVFQRLASQILSFNVEESESRYVFDSTYQEVNATVAALRLEGVSKYRVE